MNFYNLKVSAVERETPDAVSLFLEIPAELKDTFSYKAGQYLTLQFQLNGQEVRRAYSMCSSPLEKELAVTVKRVEGGLVSPHINSNIKPGDEISVSAPEGRFCPEIDAGQRKDYYFFAAGSGITPVYSIIKTILEEEPQSNVHLLYGNREKDSIIFAKGLEELQKRFEGQLMIERTLSQPPKKGLFSRDKSWEGWKGRIDAKMIKRFLEMYPNRSPQTAAFYLCGPSGMIEVAKEVLSSQGVDKRHVHMEYFTTPEDENGKAVKGLEGALAKVELNGEWVEVTVPPGKTILDALIAAKYDPPYSCTSGSCSTCMAKLQEGKVEMEVCYALDEEEVEEGYILCCQSHPKSPEVKLTFEV